MIYSIRKKKILQVKIKKNIKNVIYDYEFWKKAVIINTKLALLCVREKNWSASGFLTNIKKGMVNEYEWTDGDQIR